MKRKALIPKYAYIPLGAVVVFNFFVYYTSKLINLSRLHHSSAIPFDARIPFLPAFIVIYILAYVHWAAGHVAAANESEEYCFRIASADVIAKLICFVCFIAYPTVMARPEVTGTGFFSFLTKIIFFFDTPVNLFPSIHCLESWLVCRAALGMKSAKPWYKILMTVFAVLVFASTVFVKQHVILDVFGGIIAAEAGLFIAKKLDAGRIFERLNSFLFHRTK